MLRRCFLLLTMAAIGVGWWGAGRAAPQQPPQFPAYELNRFYYYPYYYFPHNYWPTMSPRWPEPANAPYMRPPAYMAYPPFHEPNWRYDLWQPMRYYRGNHFWLDQF